MPACSNGVIMPNKSGKIISFFSVTCRQSVVTCLHSLAFFPIVLECAAHSRCSGLAARWPIEHIYVPSSNGNQVKLLFALRYE
jgi:hypothetical protein